MQLRTNFAIDLDVLEGEVFEVVEGAKPGAEVVERERAPELGESLAEPAGLGDVADGGGRGDLEDQPPVRETGVGEFVLDQF
jgi:hypothetical protein